MLIGAGDTEYYFWKNYFYNCAVVRSKIGLSNGEIWDVPTVANGRETSVVETLNQNAETKNVSTDHDQTTSQNEGISTANDVDAIGDNASIIFETSSVASTSMVSLHSNNVGTSAPNTISSSPDKDYEIILPSDGSKDVLDNVLDTDGDEALDDLEAEIARELES